MGGLRLVDKTCNRCYILYKGIHNQELCNECKSKGYEHSCKNCNKNFLSKERYRTYCDKCVENRVWMGRIDLIRNERISKSKKKFFKTKKGKQVARSVGKQNSIKLTKYYKTVEGINSRIQAGKKLSIIMKAKIASGEFTPIITNTRTHWDAKIHIDDKKYKKFRSSWEATFWCSNKHLEFETIRIPWVDKQGDSHTYIADFFDRDKNIIYEIKPKSTWPEQQHKMQYVINHCLKNNIKFVWINEKNILYYINENDFKYKEDIVQLNKVKNAISKIKD